MVYSATDIETREVFFHGATVIIAKAIDAAVEEATKITAGTGTVTVNLVAPSSTVLPKVDSWIATASAAALAAELPADYATRKPWGSIGEPPATADPVGYDSASEMAKVLANGSGPPIEGDVERKPRKSKKAKRAKRKAKVQHEPAQPKEEGASNP